MKRLFFGSNAGGGGRGDPSNEVRSSEDSGEIGPSPLRSAGTVVVAGGGSTASRVVQRIAKVFSVVVVDADEAKSSAFDSFDGVRFVVGDASSTLVLQRAGVDSAQALIAATDDDDVNIEACRLAVASGVNEVVCRLSTPTRRQEVLDLGARPVTTASALSGGLTASLPGMVVTTTEVGLGEGDVLQVRVMPGSLVIGHPLRDVVTREYLVAAIYRDGKLVVPHGDTTVEAGDQVLLVGEPETLSAVADYFRLGAAQFPKQYGRSVVLWNEHGSEVVSAEARWLRAAAGVSAFHLLVPPGQETPDCGEATPIHLSPNPKDRYAPLREAHPGIQVVGAPRTGFLRREGLGQLGEILDRSECPILISRGSFPYRRILAPVGDSESSWRSLELAVDIARLVEARITAIHVAQPRFLGGSGGAERTDRVIQRVGEVARLYGLHLEPLVMEGNPIRKVAQVAADHQLVVTARNFHEEDTYFKPDVGLRIALNSPCSAIVLSHH